MALVLVPAFLMVSTVRFRSFKNLDLQARRPYTVLIAIALFFAFIFAHPALTLVVISYTYLLSAFIEMIVHRSGGANTIRRPCRWCCPNKVQRSMVQVHGSHRVPGSGSGSGFLVRVRRIQSSHLRLRT
jgi:hypothetical protein